MITAPEKIPPTVALTPFLDLNPNPVLMLSGDGVVTYMNRSARARFPGLHTAKEHPILANLERILPQLQKSGEYGVFVREVAYADVDYDQQILSIPAEHCIYLYMSDITERKRAEDMLRQAQANLEERVRHRTEELAVVNQSLRDEILRREITQQALSKAQVEAIQASKAKSDFLATMSHELRTPLNGVIGMADLLLGTQLNDEQRRFALIAKSSADTLLRLINDILDFSKIEAGKLILECIDFDLLSSIEEVRGALAISAEKKGIKLLTMLDTRVPLSVRGDPVRLQQILTNLISNALKFTREGEVVVSANVEKETDLHWTIRFSVSDSGIGIPADRLTSLFQPFSQADVSTTRKFGGTGLGLAICRRLSELMGGHIGVESVEGKGSKFYFTVNFEKQIQTSNSEENKDSLLQQESSSSSAVTALQFHQARILVVEDNEVNQEVMTAMLTRVGCQFDLAGNGKQAVEAVSRAPYDLILMDCQMPEMDGFAATTAIRAAEQEGRIHPSTSAERVPIIALTASATDADRNNCLAAGMDGFVTKPVSMKRLMEILRARLKSNNIS